MSAHASLSASVSAGLFAGLALASANCCWALGLQLGESKEELRLDYAVEVTDHGPGPVQVVFTLASPGRLGPLTGVDLDVAAEDGSNHVDASIPLLFRAEGGKQVARVHLRRDWAERASIKLKTDGLDGKALGLTWYYHLIPLKGYLPVVKRG